MFKHFNTFDFRTVMVDGEQMLSLVIPHDQPGTKATISFPNDEHGSGIIIDSSYNIHQTIDMRADLPRTNMHDLNILDNGQRALMLTAKSYEKDPIQLGSYEGPCKAQWQGFRELDLKTGETVFEWHAQGHIALEESTRITGTYTDMCQNDWGKSFSQISCTYTFLQYFMGANFGPDILYVLRKRINFRFYLANNS